MPVPGKRPRAVIALLVAAVLLGASPAGAQTRPRVRVTEATVVMETPRGDSIVLGRVAPGTELEFIQQSGRWIEVTAAGVPGVSWSRGWINEGAVEFLDRPPVAARARRGEFMLRGFGQVGGALFTARDSFEAILDSRFGTAYGGGVQAVFRNGLFVQGGFDRFRKTGSRAVVSEAQVFRLEVADTVTVTPILATVGYRDPRAGRLTGFAGAGVGWHLLEEQSPALAATGDYREGHIGYHVSGGAEYRLAPFLWLGGELQWASVPDGLGATGIGPAFDETDLGATTFRFKLIVGR